MSWRTLNLGELAHIVGRGNSVRSPRGEHPLDRAQRENADNLMLLCADQHGEVDAAGGLDLFTVEKLHRVKQEHEDRTRHVTGLGSDRATTVVRMVGSVHGNHVELSRQTAAAAVIAGDRYPLFLESYARHGLEIDLRGVPGESPAALCAASRATAIRAYYRMATQLVDDVIERQLRPGITRDAVRHGSVFGFARLPMLVHLGSRQTGDRSRATPLPLGSHEARASLSVAPAFIARVPLDAAASEAAAGPTATECDRYAWWSGVATPATRVPTQARAMGRIRGVWATLGSA